VALMVLSYILAIDLLQRYVVRPSLKALEHEAAVANVNRCADALEAEVEHIKTTAGDWAQWDDTYQFASDRNERYAAGNLVATAFTTLDLSVLCLYDPAGALIWGAAYDRETGRPLRVADLVPASLPPGHPLAAGAPGGTLQAGVWVKGSVPLVLCARAILRGDGTGPSRGTLVMGRALTAADVKALARRTHTDLSVEPRAVGTRDALEKQAAAWDNPRQAVDGHAGRDAIRASLVYPAIGGDGGLLLHIDMPPEIELHGHRALDYAQTSAFVMGVSLIAVLLVLMEFTVIRPVRTLTGHMGRIAVGGDLSVQVGVRRSDELGALSREFQRMIAQLAEARTRVVVRTYREAVAEMLQGVVHNVRNALASITANSERTCETLREVRTDHIERAVQELSARVADEQSQRLVRFIELGVQRMRERVETAQADLGIVAEQALRIENILYEQERLRQDTPVTEPVSITELLRDGVGMLAQWHREYLLLNITPQVEGVGKAVVPRITMAQVLANILTNAAEAAEEVQRGRAEVWIDAEQVNGDVQPIIRVSVCDNGAGIPPDLLPRLFEEGTSTKGEGGRGLGLHWSSDVVSTLGGRIWAEGRGAHGGACFYLDLPAGDAAP
jgi:two-component system NtrC family sensor kinase